MQSPPSPPRRRGRALRLLLVVALALAALLAFLISTPTAAALHHHASSPARALLVPRGTSSSTTKQRLNLRTVREATSSTPPSGDPQAADTDAVLLPDWEVLVLLHPGAAAPHGDHHNATCAFPGGAASPARSLGRMPASGRRAYTCAMPAPERRHKPPFRAPTLLIDAAPQSSLSPPAISGGGSSSEMARWSGRLVYDAATLGPGGDVLVFAKGVNPRQGVNRNASDVTCVYYRGRDASGDAVVASLPAATSAQQVFRCPPPPPPADGDLRVTLSVAGGEPIPSVATYSPPTLPPPEQKENKKKLICACTMVRDVGKFLREWVAYHAAIGVDRFFLYDNGSQDDLDAQVRHLTSEGFHVTTHMWPWPKAQEAGFSYAAAAHRGSCHWMAFVDVDEFIFSPAWAQSTKPTKSMLRSVVAGVEPDVGQVTLGCRDFGPSGQTKNPEEGVTQGYTCRRRAEERHKSLVRLDAVDTSLVNSIHHFELRPGFRWERSRHARVNHYKYQAWDEFKLKFRRRVSTYVTDWTDPVNHGSKDRTPGLGFEAVEPEGWANKFCDVQDTLLRDVTRRWFGAGFSKKLMIAPRRLGHSSS
ncbi:unnamed protein product [Urochloa decumbens]|uniref:Glycosyltransferase family 92 protein n=1 Tax=Urochloa decumbens TaxID=240449 RepID=A0ABC8ZSH9_9POAL